MSLMNASEFSSFLFTGKLPSRLTARQEVDATPNVAEELRKVDAAVKPEFKLEQAERGFALFESKCSKGDEAELKKVAFQLMMDVSVAGPSRAEEVLVRALKDVFVMGGACAVEDVVKGVITKAELDAVEGPTLDALANQPIATRTTVGDRLGIPALKFTTTHYNLSTPYAPAGCEVGFPSVYITRVEGGPGKMWGSDANATNFHEGIGDGSMGDDAEMLAAIGYTIG